MLNKIDSIRKQNSTYIFTCLKCTNEIKSKPYYFDKHSGLCRSCCVKKSSYEHIFNRLKNTAKNEKHELTLTFNDFLEFTKIKHCHYCHQEIPWKPYCYKNNQYISASYFLDRKDNDLGYTKDNCVASCSRCNYSKSNRYTYNEWFNMNSYFRDLKITEDVDYESSNS